MRRAASQPSRAARRWACGLALFVAGCNAIFDIGAGTPRPLCADELLIDDLEDGDNEICKTNDRDGSWWVTEDGTLDGQVTPRQGSRFEPTLIEEGPRGNSRYAARVRGSGFTAWGAVMGLSLTSTSYSVLGLDGVRFWMKSTTPVSISLPTLETASIRSGGECIDSTAQTCDDHFAFSITAPSPDWFEYRVPFNALSQVGVFMTWNPSHLMAFQVNVPPGVEFDVSLDDPSFYRCEGADCLPTCSDPEFPVSCGETEGSIASCRPPGTNCDPDVGLGDEYFVALGGGDPECVGIPSEQAPRCFLEGSNGIPFATRVNPYTDGLANAKLRNPEPGKVCMKGNMGAFGAAAITFIVSPIVSDFPPVVRYPFDLEALDIAAIEFTITNAPLGGVSLELRSLGSDDCEPGFYCLGPVFPLGGPNATIFTDGTVHADIADFEPSDPGPRHVLSFYFWGHSGSPVPTTYDFCLSDVKFLNSLGELVTPAPASGG